MEWTVVFHDSGKLTARALSNTGASRSFTGSFNTMKQWTEAEEEFRAWLKSLNGPKSVHGLTDWDRFDY